MMFKKYSRTPFTGCSVEYINNGQLWVKGNYKDGERDGLWEIYHDNGQLKNRGNYKDGEQEGLHEYYDEEGNLTKTEEWKDGKRIKKRELK